MDASFTAHPSLLALPEDIEKVKLPLEICHGTRDVVVKPAQAEEIRKIFAQKNKDTSQRKVVDKTEEGKDQYVIKFVDGAIHGFAVRQAPDSEKEQEQAQYAEDQAVTWFRRWLL